MKRTYKLLGVEWDHAPLPAECPVFIPNQEIQDWRKDRNLFDLEKYQRSITISEISNITIIDKTGCYHVIQVKKCECGEIYLTKKIGKGITTNYKK